MDISEQRFESWKAAAKDTDVSLNGSVGGTTLANPSLEPANEVGNSRTAK